MSVYLVRRIGIVLLSMIALAGCGNGSAEQRLARLPTVTPVRPTIAPSATPPLPTLVPIPTHTLVPPTPTDPPLAFSPDGAVTGSMARLHLAGERFATLGDPHAPVTLVEFADYGCPFCHEFEQLTFPTLRERYIDTGKVFYVYKHFPVSSRQGGLAAEAAECAGEQDRFWQMHDSLFAGSAEWDTDEQQARTIFQRYANELGLNQQTFDTCMAAGRTAAVERDFNEGQALNLNGTPTFFINSKQLVGNQSVDAFVDVLDRELAGR